MRLDDEKISKNIKDHRTARSGGSLIGGKGGGVLGFIIVLIGAYYGVDLTGVVGLGQTQSSGQYTETAEEKELFELSGKVLSSTERIWQGYFKQFGLTYREPELIIYSGQEPTGCGTGQSAMGPFYCPADQRVYLDLSFYNDMKYQLKAAGDFAFSYVIAHEIGHHVQNLLGISAQTQKAQRQARSQAQANQISVQVELQADCFAGVWGYQMQQEGRLDTGDLEEAFNAAEAVGDDRLQKQSRGYAVPDSFTHGTSAQRLAWFRKGLQSGNPAVCDTFSNP